VKWFLLVTAALAAAVVVFILVELPPRPVALDASWADGTVPGALHIHTNRSDGLGTPDNVAAAAARAGLKFVVFTDHGDATREPDPPAYRSGVLCLDGVEISTSGGHYVAIGMSASPYPLAGESRDVVEDVHRLGGFGIAAHPDSPKVELRWTDWGPAIDGLELINLDTSWRAHIARGGERFALMRALFTYPVRSSEAIAGLLTDATDLSDRWNRLLSNRRVVALAGADAHAKLVLLEDGAGNSRYSLPVPGYEPSLRVLSVHVRPASPLTGDAAADATALLKGIQGGQVYTAIDAWASPAAFEFTATNSSGAVHEGQHLASGGPVSLHVRSNAPIGYLTTVWRDGHAIKESEQHEFDVDSDENGDATYRVTIRAPGRPGAPPWVISNPIHVGSSAQANAVSTLKADPVAERLSLFDSRSTAGWTLENSKGSMSIIDAVQMTSGPELRLRYGITGGSPVGQYSGAAVETTHGVAEYDRVAFTIRGEHPMRISIQVRAEVQNAPPERWQRSIYIDASDSEHTIRFNDMRPVGVTHTPQAVPENIRAIMFIVDTTNSRPGASGRIWIKNVRLER
jgi:predicted metal-dependent phosphoesterase TrpH